MLDYIIVHCSDFESDAHLPLIEELERQLKQEGKKVDVFNLPKSNKKSHWAALSLYDYTRYCKCLICIGYPAGMSEHRWCKVIIEFSENNGNEALYNETIERVRMEAYIIFLEDMVINDDIVRTRNIIEKIKDAENLIWSNN